MTSPSASFLFGFGYAPTTGGDPLLAGSTWYYCTYFSARAALRNTVRPQPAHARCWACTHLPAWGPCRKPGGTWTACQLRLYQWHSTKASGMEADGDHHGSHHSVPPYVGNAASRCGVWSARPLPTAASALGTCAQGQRATGWPVALQRATCSLNGLRRASHAPVGCHGH